MGTLLFFCSCEENKEFDSKSAEGQKIQEIKLTSSGFENGGMIPAKYTCDDQGISPPLQWDIVPYGTKSLALICDDPDAPMGSFVHWVLFNLLPETRELKENFPNDETFSDGTRQGVSDFGKTGYGGPCPPSGTHRYFFKIYALDMEINIVHVVDKITLVKAMEEHILSQGQLMGKYKRR